MAERDELVRGRGIAHGSYSRRMKVYLAGPPYAEEYRRRAAALVDQMGWEAVDPMRRDYRGRTEGKEADRHERHGGDRVL
jgi:hypothetical protein